MTTQQWQELIAAINALRPSFWSTLVPVFAGLLGAAFGFFASVLRDRFRATTERLQQIAADLRERRQEAVNYLNQAASKWVTQWAGVESNRAEHHTSNSTVSLMFVQTGEHSDGVLQPAVLKFLNALEESVNSYSLYNYAEPRFGGNHPIAWTQRWDHAVEAGYSAIADGVREQTDRWFLHGGPSEKLAQYLSEQTDTLTQMKDASLAARVHVTRA